MSGLFLTLIAYNTHNQYHFFFFFFFVFSKSQRFTLTYSSGGFHLQIARNLLKQVFLFISHSCPAFVKYSHYSWSLKEKGSTRSGAEVIKRGPDTFKNCGATVMLTQNYVQKSIARKYSMTCFYCT